MNTTTTTNAAPLEACARLTWHGADVVLTVRADDPAVLSRRLDRALAALAAAAATLEASPAPAAPRPSGGPTAAPRPTPPARAPRQDVPTPPAGRAAPPPPAAPMCAAHGVPLVYRAPKGGGPGWYSHRTADGAWCRG